MQFIKPAKTSKIDYLEKEIIIVEDTSTKIFGECAPLPHLSEETIEECWSFLKENHENIQDNPLSTELKERMPSSLKMAFEGIEIERKKPLIKSSPTIKINGLVWMNGFEAMEEELHQKVDTGFDVIKIKVGQHDFDAECRFIEKVRKKYADKILLRLDANGAFKVDDALLKLKELQRFNIHSVEQPIAPKQWEAMEMICTDSPIDIALDEELIGLKATESLLKNIKPQYLIFKPSLHGGFSNCDEWIKLCQKHETPWWATSALESNIGLYQIALWVSQYELKLPQGLGMGSLFKENFKRPMQRNGQWLSLGNKHSG